MSYPIPGYVYCDPNFKFPDGDTKKKIFVVLGDDPFGVDRVLVARTTSKPHSDAVYGCFADHFPPCFFLSPAEGFDLDSWVLFDYLVPFEVNWFKTVNKLFQVDIPTTVALMRCAATSETIANGWRKSLKSEADKIDS